MNIYDGDSLDEMFDAPTTPANPAAAPKKCYRHDWRQRVVTSFSPPSQVVRIEDTYCVRCGAVRDEARAKRGKSSRRLGADQERRAERVYGFEKVGERGTITDLQSPMFKVQQKATRGPVPAKWRSIFRELGAVNDGRSPLLLLSFVAQGVPTEDYFVVPGHVFRDLHGKESGE